MVRKRFVLIKCNEDLEEFNDFIRSIPEEYTAMIYFENGEPYNELEKILKESQKFHPLKLNKEE